MKKVYVEITNTCNLNCSFCIKNTRKEMFMDIDKFNIILNKIKPYTDYLYLHVLGEPFMHPKINDFIELASQNFFVNITTNGYLINRLKTSNVRQINISLHSFSPKYNIGLDDYLNNIFSVVDRLEDTFISYRFWVNNEYSELILSKLNEHYNTNFNIKDLKLSNKLSDKVFINTFKEFEWPSFNNSLNNKCGTCYAIRDHIGILCDGTIVPCCLDSKGDLSLGNIFEDSIDDAIKSNKAINMLNGFKNNIKVEKLCQKCNFIDLDK